MPSLVTGTGIVCPHCRHEMTVQTRGMLFGIWRQIWRHWQVREARIRGGRVTCGNCRRTFIIRGDRTKYMPLPRGGKRPVAATKRG
jgi:uncharacterized protein YbaR (Trm112 family)